MKIAVSAESTVDLSPALLQKYDIKVIPYTIVLDGKEYKDGELTNDMLFEHVDKTGNLPKTTALNQFEYEEFFKELKRNYDSVIHVTLSSGITSSSGNAEKAPKEVGDVFVVDSKSLSTGIGLLCIYARELADCGLQAEVIAEKIKERVDNVQTSFVIERLDYLFKGGRCNSLQYFGANLLRLRPRIVLKDGKMMADKKYRGHMSAVIEKYCKELFEEFDTPDLDKVFITCSSATEDMIEAAENACKQIGFKNIYRTTAGVTVAAHCGANTLGIMYFNDGDKKIVRI